MIIKRVREMLPKIDKGIIALIAGIAIALSLAVSPKGCERKTSTKPLLPSSSPPAPVVTQPTTPPPLSTSSASQSASVVIRKRKPVPQASGSLTPIGYEEEIIEVTLKQEASASAPVVVATPHPVTPPNDRPVFAAPNSDPSHSRLGVLVGTFPGIFAFDVQLVRGTIPIGIAQAGWVPTRAAELELSLDVELNHRQVGALVTAGDKVFAGVGAYASFDLSAGYFIGAGMRF